MTRYSTVERGSTQQFRTWGSTSRNVSSASASAKKTRLLDLARIAGTRWAIEECFQQAKNEAGLDEYQVCDWRAWGTHPYLRLHVLPACRPAHSLGGSRQ